MLNLLIAMLVYKRTWILLFIAPWLVAGPLAPWHDTLWLFSQGGLPGKMMMAAWAAKPAQAAKAAAPTEAPQATISLPRPGEALQGVVSINGTTDVPGFRSAEVDFAYQTDSTGTWFLIQQSGTPVKDGALATWDTTTITDGEYRLRVRVFLQNGQLMESVVSGLRVRNYTVIETSTAEARPAGQETPTPTATPRPDFQVKTLEVTPLPTNPAQLTPLAMQASALRGVMAVLGALLAAGLYVGLRAVFRR
jgi:hypothetical protein